MKKRLASLKRKIHKAPLSAYVVFSIAVVMVYTLVVTIITTKTGQDLSDYYTVFCSIFGGEILTCALIKIFKLKEEGDSE